MFLIIIITLVFCLNAACASFNKEVYKESDSESSGLNNITIYLYKSLSTNTKWSKDIEIHYKIWLQKKQSIDDEYELILYYRANILSLFADSEYFNLVTIKLIKDLLITEINALSRDEKKLLLVQCFRHYARIHNITLSDNDDITSIDFINEDSEVYQYNKNKFIFIWCDGRGAHNNSYLVWMLDLENKKFIAKLIDIPSFDIDKSTLIMRDKVTAQKVIYDKKQDVLVISSSAGDYTGWIGLQQIYTIHNKVLTLLKQRRTLDFDEFWIKKNNGWKNDYLMDSEEVRH